MKHTSLFLVLALVSVLACSCLNGEEHHSPVIQTSCFLHYGVDGTYDTLAIFRNDKTDAFCPDTILVGDTVRMQMLMHGVTNQLLSFATDVDTSALAFRFLLNPDSLAGSPVDAAKSDFQHGQLMFRPGFSGIMIYGEYVARRAGRFELEWTLYTDSKLSPSSLLISQVVE